MLNPEKNLRKSRTDDMLKRMKRLECDFAEIATGEALAGRVDSGLLFLAILAFIQNAETRFIWALEDRRNALGGIDAK